MRIPDRTIEEIKAHIRIDEVLGDFCSLRKKGGGHTLWACCPFPGHNEKTPSFSVRPAQGFYKCFGCGEGGDTLSFLQKVQGMSYLEALEYLANKYHIAWEVEPGANDLDEDGKKKESLYLVMEEAQRYYEELLIKSSTTRDYLETRGITAELGKRFHIGYSLDAWEGFLKFATETKGYKKAILEEAGLVIKRENSMYDRFRGRLMFPLHDVIGRVVGFGGRQLQGVSEGAKYINSPETLIYHKKKFLYGLYQGKKAIRKSGFCYIVEGYTDVLALHHLGLAHVVASAGTSLTEEQVRLLKRFTTKATLLFDGDEAGLKAILRGGESLLAAGFGVEVIVLPLGEDPASYAEKVGQEGFCNYLESHAKDFLTFKTKHLLGENSDPERKVEVVHEIVRSIALMPDPIKQAVYVDLCSNLLKVEVSLIQARLQQELSGKKHTAPKTGKVTIQQGQENPPREESTILSLLLHYGNESLGEGEKLAKIIFEELDEITFTYSDYKRIYDVIKAQWKAQNEIVPTALAQGEEKIHQQVIDLMAEPHDMVKLSAEVNEHPLPKRRLEPLVYRNILRLKLKVVRNLAQEEHKKLAALVDIKEVDEQLSLYQAFKKVEIEIAQALGIVVFPPRR